VPGHGLPHTIEESCPLGHGHKRRRDKNTRTPRYPISQPRPPPVPRLPLEVDHDITPDIIPSPNTCSNRHYSNNRTPKPPHNVNADATPYSTSRLRPLPWPNKNSNKNRNTSHNVNADATHHPTSRLRPPPWPNKNFDKNRNKYYYGTHTLAGMTAKR
jgi:hypothetical protein